jgi:hypothetical protein
MKQKSGFVPFLSVKEEMGLGFWGKMSSQGEVRVQKGGYNFFMSRCVHESKEVSWRETAARDASTAHQIRSGLGPFSFLTAVSAGFTELPFILLSHASSVLFSLSFVEGSCNILCCVCVCVCMCACMCVCVCITQHKMCELSCDIWQCMWYKI